MIKPKQKTQIKKEVESRSLEDWQAIIKIERFLKQKRGFVFRMPKPGSSVVMLFSGGLDSTPLATLLMKEYGLVLYPVFTLRGHSYQNAELESLKYWTKYLQKRFTGQFQDPVKISTYFPPMEIRWAYEKVLNKRVTKGSPQVWGDFFYSNLLCTHAAQYAYFLQITKKLKVRNVFCAFMPVDGEVKSDMTLTSLRGTMLGICAVTNDYSWQISSIPIEKELGFYFDKDFFIKWANEEGIPLHNTRSSCMSTGRLHCGTCELCKIRKRAFAKASVVDKTKYLNDLNWLERKREWVSDKIIYKTLFD